MSLGLYVSSATESFERRCLRRRTSGARQALAVIPSCDALSCETAKFPAHVEVERTPRDGFGGAIAMPDYLRSQLQVLTESRILGVIL
jgi:hypothetical protein